MSSLAFLGGNVGALARLARQDRSALQAELKSIGISKVGVRVRGFAGYVDAVAKFERLFVQGA